MLLKYIRNLFLLFYFFSSFSFSNELSIINKALVEDHLKHADTYYWLSRARGSTVYDIEKTIYHLNNAKFLLDGIENEKEIKLFQLKIDNGLNEAFIQKDEAYDELINYTPLFLLLTNAEKNIEYFDDPLEVAIEKSIASLIESNPRIFTFYQHTNFIIPIAEKTDDKLLFEEIAHHYINNNTSMYLLTRRELNDILNEDEVKLLNDIKNHPKLLDKISESLSTPGIGILDIVLNDQVDNIYYASSYYQFWDSNKGLFKDQSSSYEFVQSPKSKPIYLLFLLLIGFPFTYLFNKMNPKSEGSYAPLWLSTLASVFGIILITIFLKSFNTLGLSGNIYFWAIDSILILLSITFIISILPFLFIYIIASKIKRISSILNNPETISSLIFGSNLAMITFLASLASILFELKEIFIFFFISIITTALFSFIFGRAYANNAVTNNRDSRIEYILLIISLFIYVLSIIKLDLSILLYSSISLTLFFVIVKSFTGILIRKLSISSINEISLKERGEVESGIQWLRNAIREPKFFYKPWKSSFEKVKNFVAVQGLEDPEIEVVFIEGEMGCGKTRVAHEIAKNIKSEYDKSYNTTILFGDCDEFNKDADLVPYEPFAQALSNFLQIGRFSNPADKAEKLKNSLMNWGVEDAIGATGAGVLGVLLDAQDKEGIQKTNVNEMTKIIAETITRLSDEKDGKIGKVIFIIDDTQWMDDNSFELLVNLFEVLNNDFTDNQLSFILTSRTVGDEDKVKNFIQDLEKQKKINVNWDIDTSTLENEGVIDGILETLRFNFKTKQIFHNYLSDHGIRRPLHCLQLIETAIESDVIDSYGDAYLLKKGTNLNNLPPPNDFVQMVEKELALLDPLLVSVLKCSAIIGRSFRASIIARIFNIEILNFLDLIKGAEDRNIIRDVSEEDDVYEFVDKRMLGIFRGLIIKSEDGREPQIIKEFHKKYITIKLDDFEERQITPDEMPYRDILSLASHANAISDVTLNQAIEYNSLAAKKSYERGLYKISNDYFESSIELIKNNDVDNREEKLTDLYLNYAICLIEEHGKYDDINRILSDARKSYEKIENKNDKLLELEINLSDSINNFLFGNYEIASDLAIKVINDEKKNTIQELRARFINIASTVSWKEEFQKSKSELLDLFNFAEDMIKKDDDFNYRNNIYNIQTEILNEIGHNFIKYGNDTDSAIEFFTKAIEFNEKDGVLEQSSNSISYAGLGDCYSTLKDQDKAKENYEKSLTGARNIGNNRLIGIITYKIALFLLEKASFEENDLLSDDIAEDAEELLEESLTISEDRNSINGIFRALSGLLNRSLISNELEMVDFIYLKLDEYQNKFHIIEEEIKKSIEDSLSKISDISDIHRERSNALLLSFKKE